MNSDIWYEERACLRNKVRADWVEPESDENCALPKNIQNAL